MNAKNGLQSINPPERGAIEFQLLCTLLDCDKLGKGSVTLKEIHPDLGFRLGLSIFERSLITNEGTEPVFDRRVQSACKDLRSKGYVSLLDDDKWALTPQGKAYIENLVNLANG